MHLLPNNKHNWPATALLRGALAMVFIIWLAMVMTQYDDDIPEKTEINNKPPPSHIMIEQLALPAVPKPKAKPTAQSQSTTTLKPTKQPEDLVKPTTKVPKQTPVSKQQVEQVYQQLSAQGVDIQIAWPQQTNNRQAALDFMYQCADMQFAVLNDNQITKVNQSTLSDYSDWVRVAQGSLSKKEHNWLTAYSLTGTAIRLFPREIDWRLAQYLAKALQGQPLSNLRANYRVTNQKLQLTHIQVNNQQIADSWTLYQGECI